MHFLRTALGGLLAATVAAGSVSLLAPTPTAHAVDWTDPHVLTADNSGFGEVRVASTNTTGGAVAAWIDGDTLSDRVRTATATGGSWGAASYLSAPGVDTAYLVLDANDEGDVAAAWLEQEGDTWRAMAARRLNGTWSAATPLSGVLPVDNDYPALAVAGDGTIFVAFPAVVAGKSTMQLRTWRPGQAPVSAQVAPEFATTPMLDAGENGDAVLTFALDQATDSVYAAEYHHGSQQWDAPEQVSFIGVTSYQPAAAVDPTGRSTLAYSAKVDGVWRIHVVTENQQGTAWGLPVAVSSTGSDGYQPSLAVDAAGRALLAWHTVKNGVVGAVYSHRAGADSPWPSATALAVPTSVSLYPEVDLSDAGTQLIDLVSGDRRFSFLRTRPTDPFVKRDWGNGYGTGTVVATTDADLGNDGHGVLISKFQPTEGYDEVRVRFLDGTGPTTALDPLPANTLAHQRTLTWTTTDDLSPVPGTDLFARASAWNVKGFSTSQVGDGATSPFVVDATPGTTYCFTGRSVDAADNAGPDSAERCTTLPLDDTSLKGAGWQRTKAEGSYLGTVARTATHGRVLVRKGVRAHRLALVVAKSARGGRVSVRFGKSDLGTYSLKGAGKKKVVPLATFPGVKAGTVRIRVVSATGRVVKIDGLVVAK